MTSLPPPSTREVAIDKLIEAAAAIVVGTPLKGRTDRNAYGWPRALGHDVSMRK
jgi:hypothetical protein